MNTKVIITIGAIAGVLGALFLASFATHAQNSFDNANKPTIAQVTKDCIETLNEIGKPSQLDVNYCVNTVMERLN